MMTFIAFTPPSSNLTIGFLTAARDSVPNRTIRRVINQDAGSKDPAYNSPVGRVAPPTAELLTACIASYPSSIQRIADILVPEGRPIIAQRFNIGAPAQQTLEVIGNRDGFVIDTAP